MFGVEHHREAEEIPRQPAIEQTCLPHLDATSNLTGSPRGQNQA